MLRVMSALSRAMAVLGGIVLVLLIAVITVSVVGRGINTFLHSTFMQSAVPDFANWLIGIGIGPIRGDYEIVEVGIAFAIFAFLPLCQFAGAHASVDLFTARLSVRTNRVLLSIAEILFAVVLVIIAWRLYDGLQSKLSYGETTLDLQLPVWWGYAASQIGATMAAIVSVFVAFVRVGEAVTNKDILIREGAEH